MMSRFFPLVITTWPLCRATRKPSFSKTRIASRWLMPGSFGIALHRHQFARVVRAFRRQLALRVFLRNLQPQRDGFADVGAGFLSRRALRPAAQETL